MRKIITLLFIIFISYSKAQNKFPMPGADWHYMTLNGLGGVYPPYNSNIEIKYTGDTIIDGLTAAIISNSSSFSETNGTNSNYFYSSNDSVFLYNPYTFNQWQLLYSFSTPVGQSWKFRVQPISWGGNTTWIVHVDSITKVVINNDTLKKLFVTYQDSVHSLIHSSSIIERMGDVNYLINILDYGLYGLCDGCPFITGILCYQDSTFNLYQPDISKPCNYYNLDIKQLITEQIRVYPNPTSNYVKINITQDISEIKIFDVLGKEVHIPDPLQRKGNSMTIDVNSLQSGVYFIQVKTKENNYTQKFIKE